MPRLSPEKWKEIETLYVYGVNENGNLFYPTLEWLSERFNVSISAISLQKKEKQWDLYRERNQNKTGKLVQIKKEERIKTQTQTQTQNSTIIPAKPEYTADVMASFDISCLNQTNRILEESNKFLDELEKMENDSKKVWILEMVSKILERAQKIGKVAIGEKPIVSENKPIEIRLVRSERIDD